MPRYSQIFRPSSWWGSSPPSWFVPYQAAAKQQSAAFQAQLKTLSAKQEHLMSITSDLTAAVAAEKSETLAARMAIQGLLQQISDLNTKVNSGSMIDTAAIQQAISDLAADAQVMATAIPAGGGPSVPAPGTQLPPLTVPDPSASAPAAPAPAPADSVPAAAPTPAPAPADSVAAAAPAPVAPPADSVSAAAPADTVSSGTSDSPVVTTDGPKTTTVDTVSGTTTVADSVSGTTTVVDHETGDAIATSASGADKAPDPAVVDAAVKASADAGVTVPPQS